MRSLHLPAPGRRRPTCAGASSLVVSLVAAWVASSTFVASPAWAQHASDGPGEGATIEVATEGGEDASEMEASDASEPQARDASETEARDASEEEARIAEARDRFAAGVALARAGNCQGALAELRASLSLVERPNTLFNAARCYEELFRYDLAVATYERYLEVAEPEATDRAAVEATMRSLRNLLGVIVLRANVPAQVWIGDRVVGEAPGEVLVPGGRHALELRAEGHLPERREVEVAGRQRVELELTLERAEMNVTNVDNRQVLVEDGGAPPALFWSGVVATGVAAVVAGAFGGATLAARGRTRDLSPYDRAGIAEGNDRVRRSALLADVFLGVTGALAVTTLVLYFLTDFDGDAATRGAVVRVGPTQMALEVTF